MDRDKALTEAMGRQWVGNELEDGSYNHDWRLDLSTWEGFGKLWEWAIKQEWWQKFLNANNVSPDFRFRGFDTKLISPDTFPNALYKYLKERGE